MLACGATLRAGDPLGAGRLVFDAGVPAGRWPDERGRDDRSPGGGVSADRGADERGAVERVVGRGDRAGGLVIGLL